MAQKQSVRKRKFAFRFELGLGGLAGLLTICFCIFLWMFLLGVWAGQTVLLPEGQGETAKAMGRFSARLWSQGQDAALPPVAPGAAKADRQDDAEEEPSFFTLQVASYESEENAHQEVLDWQAKGEEAFLVKPRDGSAFFRVFVGRYETLAVANEKVDQLEEAEHLQAFITLLPESGSR